MNTDEHAIELRLVSVRDFQMEVQIVKGEVHHDMTVGSVFSEPLRDLLELLGDARLLLDGRDLPKAGHFEFEWLGEGLLYCWKAAITDDGQLSFKVSFSGSPILGGKQYQVWEIEFIISWEEFARQLVRQCGGLLRRYGFQGYRQHWGRDFPVAQVLGLADTMQGEDEDASLAHELELLRAFT